MKPIDASGTNTRRRVSMIPAYQVLRAGLVGAVLLALLAGLWAALIRIGWALPAISAPLPGIHGPLMISGVLGTLIALERAVALTGAAQRRLHPAFLVPMSSAIGGLL